jgi:hypothetical protein
VRHQGVFENREVLHDALAWHLGLAAHVLEVQRLAVECSCDLEKAEEGLHPSAEALFLDLFTDIGVHVRVQDVAGRRGLVDHERQRAPFEGAAKVECRAEFSGRKRLEPPRGRAAREQVGALTQQLARRRPAQREPPAA